MNQQSALPIVHLVAGARPNFMKVAPLFHELKKANWCTPVFIHTGQHFNNDMSDVFLKDLSLPRPDFALTAGRGTHAQQTASIMLAYEQLCFKNRPDWVVVVGDVNSTLACALVAKKLGISVIHLEAGLRSGDRTMPEEINRICTDAIADLLWTPSPDADENLRREGIEENRIVRVGNIMLDNLIAMKSAIESRNVATILGLGKRPYGVVTLHRPSNVDDFSVLGKILSALLIVSHAIPLVFAIHPRTRRRLDETSLGKKLAEAPKIICIEPLGYLDFMSLIISSDFVITDSGGIQEETTFLGIPCLTLRENTERPITISQGTNRLVRPGSLMEAISHITAGNVPKRDIPEFWDGKTAQRAAQSLRYAIHKMARQ